MAQSRKAENAKKRRRWKKHLKDWAASDRTYVDYCQAHNLSPHQFKYWKKRLHSSEKAGGFLPIYWYPSSKMPFRFTARRKYLTGWGWISAGPPCATGR